MLRRAAGLLGLACFGGLVFAVALALTLPAASLARFAGAPPQVSAVSGGLWHGRAAVAGGLTAEWRYRGGAWRLRPDWAVTLAGPATRLEATAFAGPGGAGLADLAGRAGPELLGLVGVEAACGMAAVLDVALLRIGRGRAAAEGSARVPEGACALPGGGTTAVPALDVALGTEGRDAVAAVTSAGTALGGARITGDRRAVLRVEPEGAALIPGMPSSSATVIEVPF